MPADGVEWVRPWSKDFIPLIPIYPDEARCGACRQDFRDGERWVERPACSRNLYHADCDDPIERTAARVGCGLDRFKIIHKAFMVVMGDDDCERACGVLGYLLDPNADTNAALESWARDFEERTRP